ncbi:type VI secretion system Vgr family protein [Vibrio sp. CJQ_6]|uniref:type VI secretion system Vgr family protein n=1 Tax=Vibrio sp. CJQ_6 TaxID=3367165 RepID=UPI00370BE7E5
MNELIDAQGSYLVVQDANGNEFVASTLSVTEQINQHYEWQADIIVSDSSPADWIGTEVSCSVYNVIGDSRTSLRQYQGYVVKAQAQSQRIDSSYYGIKLTVQPWLFLLKHSRQCRVFQEQTAQDIVTSIFDELGFSGQYTVNSMPSTSREYCVQFGESDFEFVTRLLAEDGVHFYFGKDANAAKLYLQEAQMSFEQSDMATLDYAAAPSGDYDVLETWQREYAFHSASLEIAGYDYSQSKVVTSGAKASSYAVSGNTKLKEYRYPTASITNDFSSLTSTLGTLQRGQLDSGYDRVHAKTPSADLCVGQYLKLAAHSDSAEEGNYLVTELHYQFENQKGNAFSAQAELVCVPEDQVFYPPAKARPVLHGLQSAVVAGSTESEPASDTSGRVRIKFHWDDETGDKTSCWVRVAQGMAGSGYGMQFLPRAGQEVLVSFINGDPDQPVVVASVYNSTNTPPYPTENTTESGVKTKLAGESNELRFDDKKDNELLYLHAAKDFTSEVVNDHSETVGGEMTLAVTKNLTETIEQSHSLSAKEGITLTTEKSYALTVTESITQDGKDITLTGSDSLTLKVGDSSIVMSSDKIEISSSTIALTADSAISLSGGDISQSGDSISLDSDGSLSASSGSSMSLSAGSSFTASASSSATVSGLNATLSADVTATVSGSATAELSSDGQASISGTLVMVN